MSRGEAKQLAVRVALLVVALLGFACVHGSAQAASKSDGIVKLAYLEDDSYKRADVTGDGERDAVSEVAVKNKYGYTTGVTLSVNGKTVKAWNNRKPEIRIITMADKRSYLEIGMELATGKNVCGLYRVESGKLEKVLDYRSLVNRKLLIEDAFINTGYAFDYVFAQSVKGNVVRLSVSLGTKSLGQIRGKGLRLRYRDGAFRLLAKPAEAGSSYCGDSGQFEMFRAMRRIKVYKSVELPEVAFKMAEGTKFRITKSIIMKKMLYVKVKTNKGKRGWIKLSGKQLVKKRALVVFG